MSIYKVNFRVNHELRFYGPQNLPADSGVYNANENIQSIYRETLLLRPSFTFLGHIDLYSDAKCK